MFNFLNTPYMSGSQTSRNSYRPAQRGFDPWGSYMAEPEPVYYHNPRRSVYNRGTPYYDAEYMPRQAPVRNSRASYVPNTRPMNQSMVYEEPSLFNEPRRVQRPQQRPQQQAQQPRVTKPTHQRTATAMPQNTNTRRTRETAPQDPFSFFDMFGSDPFFGNTRAPVYRPNKADEYSSDEEAVGSSHTPVETVGKGPIHTQKAQQAKTNTQRQNEFNNMRQQQRAQPQPQPQAKPKASAQPNTKAAQEQPPQPKVIQIAASRDPKDLVTIEDETPAQQRVVEGKLPSNGLVIEEVNPQQA